jgi:hypothetical protein
MIVWKKKRPLGRSEGKEKRDEKDRCGNSVGIYPS